MKEADALVGIFTHMETVLAFAAVMLPGFLSLRAYEAARGGEARKINESLVDVVIYSIATDVVWCPVLLAEQQISTAWLRWTVTVVSFFAGFLGTALLVGWGWYHVQRRLARSGIVRDPVAKPWDKMFQRIADENLDVGIVLTLKDGQRLGGRYRPPGFASRYPADEQLHIGEAWLLDPDDGAFVQRVEGTFGFIIDKADILTIEFTEWRSVTRPAGAERERAHGE